MCQMAFENFDSFKSYGVGGEWRRGLVKVHPVYIRFGIPSTHILGLKSNGIIAKTGTSIIAISRCSKGNSILTGSL